MPSWVILRLHGAWKPKRCWQGLRFLPRRLITYRDRALSELDTDAVIARRPQLVLVDELAHTNLPGSRHVKRFQDVEEILDAGIDVYTTLNIQHLESLNNVIAQITGITVRETIPDRMIDDATDIELIDLPPDELLNRLRDGKVYIPEQAARAIQRFFRKGNLTALRELSMRRAAERVDDQMRDYMQVEAIPGPWPAGERLMVCVSPSPMSERLVRSTRRLADELNAEWLALYVELPEHARLTQDQRNRLGKTLLLVEELGGRSYSLPGSSVAETALNYAQMNNITKIIVGKPLQARWRDFFFGSVVDDLVRNSGKIDVYVISSESDEKLPAPTSRIAEPPIVWKNYGFAVLILIAAFGVGRIFRPYFSPTNLVMVFLLAVVVSAVYLGRGPSVLVSFLGVLVFDYFFVPPFLTFAISDTEYILTFIGLFGVGLVISELTARVRDRAEVAQRREIETARLYALSRDLSVAEGLEEIVQSVIANIAKTFNRETIIFLPDDENPKSLHPHGMNADFDLDQNELAVADWTFRHGQPAGRGTDTLAAADTRFIPLKTANGVIGVIGIRPGNPENTLTADQRRLLETFTSQAALAIEHARLAEQVHLTRLLQAAEKLQTALLNSISHDLRTPLVSIKGALTSLAESGPAMNAEIRQRLIETAVEETDRMNRLVGNLLNMTRLEAGAMQVVKKPGDLLDAIGTALENLGERSQDHSIMINVPDNFALVPMDFVLIVQVLVNLIDNSLKYSAPGTPIEIRAHQEERKAQVIVSDREVGIPTGDLEHIFDKFYRVQRPENISGTGLGLSISKGIVEAHGGSIWAENRVEGGATISFTLPLEEYQEAKQ